MNKKLYYLFPLLLLASCSSKVESQLSRDTISIRTESTYADSVLDFKDSIESVTNESFNFHKVETRYIEYSSIELQNSINKNGLGEIVSISEEETKTNYNFKIDINNYETLSNIFPEIKNEKVAVYLAKYNVDESEEDYLDMIEFVFSEEARKDLEKSYINLSFFKDDGKTFTELKNCKIVKDRVELSFRLLDFLLLKEPIEFSFSTIRI